MDMFYNFRVEYSFDHEKQSMRSHGHEMSFKVITPKPDQTYNKIAESNFRRPRLDSNNLVASEIDAQNNQIENFYQLSSKDGISYEKRLPLDLDYAYDYSSYSDNKGDGYYYNEQALPDHIVI